MFSIAERAALSAALITAARADQRITGIALTGSGALVRSLDPDELARAFGVVTRALIAEIDHVDAALAERLAGPLRELAGPQASPPPAKTSLSGQGR